MQRVNGLHHITAICGPAQENLDFYAGVLGMRLVKKSVNRMTQRIPVLCGREGHQNDPLLPMAQLDTPRLDTGSRGYRSRSTTGIYLRDRVSRIRLHAHRPKHVRENVLHSSIRTGSRWRGRRGSNLHRFTPGMAVRCSRSANPRAYEPRLGATRRPTHS